MANGKAGAPSKYKAAFDEQAQKLCELGATDAQLGDFFGVSEVTINAWKLKHPTFVKSLKLGKGVCDDLVERSLLGRAVGFKHEDVHVSNFQGDITLTPITKQYPPDVTACIFWLKNRRKESWRDKQEIDLGGEVAITKVVREFVEPDTAQTPED